MPRNLSRIATRLVLLTFVLACLAAARPAQALDSWQVCAQAARLAETLRPGLPAHLLTAIARVESGRWHKEQSARVAWPWTIMAEGRGRFLPSKAAAVREVKRLRAKGVTNIDVGCMQVNLHYHGHAFDSAAEALDPAANVAYAAEFLLKLHRTRGSWTRAIGDYHSATPRHSGPYRVKVFRAWRAVKKAAYAEARRRRQAQLARADDD